MDPLVASGTNYWGRKIIDPLKIVRKNLDTCGAHRCPVLVHAVNLGLDELLKAVGAPRDVAGIVKQKVLHPPQNIKTVSDYEVFAHDELKKVVDESSWRRALKDRTRTIVQQIRNYVPNNVSLLDVGCGDGMVGWKLRDHCSRIELCDVVDYVHHDIRQDVKFHLFADGEPLPVDGYFDEALLITVLHHTRDPGRLLDSLRNRAKELIIIESVYFNDSRRFFHQCEVLAPDEQFIFASYFDWFYNRVINRGVPVTFNYGTPEQWRELLARHGYAVTLVAEEGFGVDIPLVPEYHVLIKASHTDAR